MKEVSYVLVVEGKSDVDFLQTFLHPIAFVTTNGSEISQKTMQYLKELSKQYPIVVLTDPDSPGKRIRDKIASEIPSVQHAFVEKKFAIKKKKVGVAESDQAHVLLALKHCLGGETHQESHWEMEDLIQLGLSGKEDSAQKREQLMEAFHLGFGNAKTLCKRLNLSSLSKKEVEEWLKAKEKEK